MKQTIKTYRFDSALYREVHVRFEIIVDGATVLHELREDLYCNDTYEIKLDINRLNEAH